MIEVLPVWAAFLLPNRIGPLLDVLLSFFGHPNFSLLRTLRPFARLWRMAAQNARHPTRPDQRAALTSIFFCFAASAVFGSVTVSTPLASSAVILSASTPSGRENERWNEP